jgi:lysozyme family protein
MITPEVTEAGYRNLWNACVINPEKAAAADELAAKIVSNKTRYQTVEAQTEVPWFVIGCWHYREANFDFNTFLGNGQPLNQVTTQVPAGLGPWDSWEAGAVEALKKYRNPLPWTVEFCLYNSEAYNGFGYFSKNINSPYVWSWTNQYVSGKYTADHVFSPGAVDVQCGCAAILKALEHSGAIAFKETKMPDTPAVPTVVATHPVTGQQFTLPQINIAEIESALKTIGTILPIAATFFPPLKAIVPILPIVDGLLQAVMEAQAGGNIPAIIAKQLEVIAAQIKASFPAQPS